MVWSMEFAEKIYGISGRFRKNFLEIGGDGKLYLRIGDKRVNLYDLMVENNLTGAYIRVLPLIRQAMDQVIEVFNEYFRRYGYRGGLYPVYPLKVNAREAVLDTIYEYGEKYRWGFNLNTYTEIKAVEKYLDRGPRMIVFDGLLSDKIVEELRRFYEREWFVVVDISSLRDAEILDKHRDLPVGLRIKYVTRGRGPWKESSGLDSKFGLTINVLYKVIDRYDWIFDQAVLLHMHPGSQIHSIGLFNKYFNEAATTFSELRRIGFKRLEYMDFGGGLAYPYHVAGTGSIESPNYGLREYVDGLLKALSTLSIHPHIVFENGRYIVSSHRIVVSKIIDVRPYKSNMITDTETCRLEELESIGDVEDLAKYISGEENVLEVTSETMVHDVEERRRVEERIACFDKLVNEKIYELIGGDRESLVNALNNRVLREHLIAPSYRFYIASSIFAHIPDKLVVNQYFQVVPLQRLNEEPEVLAVLSDLTCDSMGEFGDFITHIERDGEILFTLRDKKILAIPGKKLVLKGIPLHMPRPSEPYYVAILDTGAYQDMLSMNHNSLNGYNEVLIDLVNGEIRVEVKRLPVDPYEY